MASKLSEREVACERQLRIPAHLRSTQEAANFILMWLLIVSCAQDYLQESVPPLMFLSRIRLQPLVPVISDGRSLYSCA